MKVNLRLGKGLHAHLVKLADEDGVSMNTYLLGVLAGATHYAPPMPDDQEADDDDRVDSRKLA